MQQEMRGQRDPSGNHGLSGMQMQTQQRKQIKSNGFDLLFIL